MNQPETAGMRVAIYARVSTEEQREGQTINSQLSELERFARDRGWVICGQYKDDGWSGGIMDRPELDRLRDDARKDAFQAVLINDVDRLARDVAHLGVIKRDLERKAVQVIFRKLPSEASPTHNLMVNILGSFAEFERELIIDRTRRGRRHAVEVKKQYLASHTAYGYRYTPKGATNEASGVLRIERTEARVVRQMFEWVDVEGLSAMGVLRRLNLRHIPTQKGAPWAKSSVLRILHNEMYAGVWHYNKGQCCEPIRRRNEGRYLRRVKTSIRIRPKQEWIPLALPSPLLIVPHDRWERVQKRIQHNKAFSPRNEKHFYLLKGLVKCGGCGCRYVGDPCHGKFYYRCLKRCKRFPAVTERKLDQVVLNALENALSNPELVVQEIEHLRRNQAAALRRNEADNVEAEAEIRRIQTEEVRLLEAYRTEIISPAQLASELERLKARRANAEAREESVASAVAIIPNLEGVVFEYCADVVQRIRHLAAGELRELLRSIIDHIVFEGDTIRIQGHLSLTEERLKVPLSGFTFNRSSGIG